MKNDSTVTIHPARYAILLAAAFGLVAAGCGGSGEETIRVQGRVTFDGGDCPAAGTVYFTPTEVSGGRPLRPASAGFQTDGNFTVSSFGKGDGLVPGKYRVRVECWKQPPGDGGTPGISYVPAGYQAPDLIVEPDTRGVVEVNCDVPKPQ